MPMTITPRTGILVGMLAALLGLRAPAAALTASATLQGTVVKVQGSGATPGHSVYWDGLWGGFATATGTFAFYSGDVPAECIGNVTADLAKVTVAVQGCSPQCPPRLQTCTTSLNTCTTSLATCLAEPVCGDGMVGAPEQCDVGTLNGKTCQTQGFAGGTLACGPGCVFDTSGCYAQRFVDNGDGTITDHQTGLMWEKKSQDGSVHDVGHAYTWTTTVGGSTPNGTVFTDLLGTLNNCVSINGSTVTGGFAGHCDWRLATIAELLTITDTSRFPTVAAVFDTGCGAGCTVTSCSCTAADFYWSSTTFAGFSSAAWFVNFIDGVADFVGKSSARRVRAVRGGR